jgi:hypothetical protein
MILVLSSVLAVARTRVVHHIDEDASAGWAVAWGGEDSVERCTRRRNLAGPSPLESRHVVRLYNRATILASSDVKTGRRCDRPQQSGAQSSGLTLGCNLLKVVAIALRLLPTVQVSRQAR